MDGETEMMTTLTGGVRWRWGDGYRWMEKDGNGGYRDDERWLEMNGDVAVLSYPSW